jgi:hypothetical protein
MSLAIVLDMDPRWWVDDQRITNLLDSIKLFIAAVGATIPFPSQLDVAVIAAFPDKAEIVAHGPWRTVTGFQSDLQVSLQARANGSSEVFESPVAQAISRGLCFIKKRGSEGHIVVFDCSQDPTDFSAQTVALSNCAWACGSLAKTSVVALGSSKPSSALLGLVSRTCGIFIPHQFTLTAGGLSEALLFHLVAPMTYNLKVRPQETSQEMNASCVCHNKVVDKGYICSICLSIHCSDAAGICSVCGSRIRREAKDELPVHSQVFTRLFTNSSVPTTQNIFS